MKTIPIQNLNTIDQLITESANKKGLIEIDYEWRDENNNYILTLKNKNKTTEIVFNKNEIDSLHNSADSKVMEKINSGIKALKK